jgi:hypothetical protein
MRVFTLQWEYSTMGKWTWAWKWKWKADCLAGYERYGRRIWEILIPQGTLPTTQNDGMDGI